MADIHFMYTDSDGSTHVNTSYQCDYSSKVFSNDENDEVVYITKKDPVNCTSETTVIQNNELYKFDLGYIYFVRITDTNDNEIVEYTRIYELGKRSHENVYGICEDGKCKVPVRPADFYNKTLWYGTGYINTNRIAAGNEVDPRIYDYNIIGVAFKLSGITYHAMLMKHFYGVSSDDVNSDVYFKGFINEAGSPDKTDYTASIHMSNSNCAARVFDNNGTSLDGNILQIVGIV